MGSAPPFATVHNLAPSVRGKRRVFCCHRATYSGRYYPNSLAAVRDAVEHGAPRLEIDVRFLADDAMLIFHDGRLDHETSGSGPVGAIGRAEARALRYRDGVTPLCFLEDVVDVVRGSETLLQVDLKLMRSISAGRLRALADALAPVREQVLVGSQAHWNLRPLREAGHRVALDPTLQWHYQPERLGDGLNPGRLGVHGLWDDAPIAHLPGVEAREYVRARVDDLLGLLPVGEWMVDYGTILHLRRLGVELGGMLEERGVELAAWTVKDRGEAETRRLLDELFACGVYTVITDEPVVIAGYAGAEA